VTGAELTTLVGALTGVSPEAGVPVVEIGGAGVPATVVITPFGRVLVNVESGASEDVLPSVADWPEVFRVFSETVCTGFASSTVEVSRAMNQITGPTASRTDSELTIGPTGLRRPWRARVLARCRPGLGESVMGGRILFVRRSECFVVPRAAVVQVRADFPAIEQ
jgi:hypothetical protein